MNEKFTQFIELLDHGFIEFIESWGSDERIIESARMSTDGAFRGWGTKDEPGDEKLLKYLWENRHTTPFEMCGMTLEVKAPIMVFREWMRHRTQSFNEMSGRYVPLPDENYMPTLERLLTGTNTVTTNKQAQGSGKELSRLEAEGWSMELETLYAHAQRVYEKGIKLGIPKELARLAVPVARYSKMRVSANLLNWLRFFTLRTDGKAQYEIRVYANAINYFLLHKFPRTWEVFNKRIQQL